MQDIRWTHGTTTYAFINGVCYFIAQDANGYNCFEAKRNGKSDSILFSTYSTLAEAKNSVLRRIDWLTAA